MPALEPAAPAVAGLVLHRPDGARQPELCLCTLTAQTLELRPLESLLSDASADRGVRLPLGAAYAYASDDAGALTVALAATGERHHLVATSRTTAEARATGHAWLQRLAGACGGLAKCPK